MKFTNKNKQLLGIDISTSAVRVVELRHCGSRLRLTGFGALALPTGAVVDKTISNPLIVGEALKTCLARMGSTLKHGAAAVAGASVITKTISVPPGLSEEQLESRVEIEADQHIPFPLDEVTLDFYVLGRSEKAARVLLVACRKATVDAVVEALNLAAINASIIDFEPFARQRVLLAVLQAQGLTAEAVVLAADMGANSLESAILHKGTVVYSREQPFGSRQLLAAYRARHGLAETDARRQAAGQPEQPDTAEAQALAPFRRQLLQQLRQTLQAAPNHNTVDAVVLSGGAALMPGVQPLLQAGLAAPVITARPQAFIDCSAVNRQPGFARLAPSLLVATGLAMRGVQ